MKPLEDALHGRLPAGVALCRLMLSGTTPDAIRAWLATHDGAAMLPALAQAETILPGLRALLAQGEPDDLPGLRALYRRAAALSPDAAVAAWSLGDPDALHAATREVADWLAARGLLHGAALDLGSGTGRLSAALASRGMAVLGIDLSPDMIAVARARHPGLSFALAPGDGLAWLQPRRFHLILAADVFPHLHRAGLAARHVNDAAALLAPGGTLAILNLSYRDDLAADHRDAAAWARANGLTLLLAGARPFTRWDGQAFLLARRAG